MSYFFSYIKVGEYMKNIKYGILLFIFLLSFYLSDKALLYVESMSPIMKQIESYDGVMESKPVNAIINDNEIIPGRNGKVLNKRESYLKMNDFGKFNETFFVYDDIKPKISLYDNLDKIIIRGSKEYSVSLIVDNDSSYQYLIDNKIPFTKIVSNKDEIIINDNITYVNSNYDEKNFVTINSYLRKKRSNSKICLIGISNLELCKKNKYLLVKNSIDIYKNNISDVINIVSGDIIYLHNDLSLSDIKYIISSISYNNLIIEELDLIVNE